MYMYIYMDIYIYKQIYIYLYIFIYIGLTDAQKEIIKKSESKFLALDVKPEYEIDKINNG
jgi:hypothetical protein